MRRLSLCRNAHPVIDPSKPLYQAFDAHGRYVCECYPHVALRSRESLGGKDKNAVLKRQMFNDFPRIRACEWMSDVGEVGTKNVDAPVRDARKAVPHND